MVRFTKNVLDYKTGKIKDSCKWKYCDEYKVMAALMYFYPEKYWDLEHSDKPDLRLGNFIGIEVTRCNGEIPNKIIGLSTSYRLGKNGTTFEDTCKKIAKLGGELNEFSLFFPVIDEESQFIPIKKGIDNKFIKLKDYRFLFEECSLAILIDEPFSSVIEKTIDYFCKKNTEQAIIFDNLIILANEKLIIYDYKTKLKSEQDISKEESTNLEIISVMTAYSLQPDLKKYMIKE